MIKLMKRCSGPLAAAILLLLSACAVTKTERSVAASPKPKSCPIQVFYNESEVPRPFEVLCTIESGTGLSLFHDRSVTGAIAGAKEEACLCGAEAIIVEKTRNAGISFLSQDGNRAKATVKAIRYKN